ncbi:MAG: minor capsid protein, partial [Lachnospiraceae bacterium]|nr:minor capsid protein [Lachnospiraceae bacterium]
ADNNGITMQEARRQLSAAELKELKWDVNEYIKYGRQNAIDQQWMKQLENASAKFHISRLEALKLRTQNALEVAYGNELDSVDAMMKRLYQSDYYHSIFEVQKGFNLGWEVGQIDERKLQKIISKPWAADGMNFSDRIWKSKTTMVNDLHQELTRTIIQGKAPDEAIKHMRNFVDKKTKNAKYAAGRLVMTEQAFISSAAQKDAFNELDVKEFEIVATLDSHTSETCQDMDGQHFHMKDFEPGVTAPPFHVFCRSTTVPYFADNYTGERAARGEDGKTYYVPDSMTYKEWKKTLGSGNADGLQEVVSDGKIVRNYQSDLAQKFGQEHYDGMHDLIDSCENPSLQKVWEQYEGDIKVADAKYKGHEHCIGSNIYVNGERDAKGNTWQAPFQVSFHESGHAIDSLASKKGTGVGHHYSSRYKDGVFPQTIKDEVQEWVNKKAEVIKQAFKEHKGDWKWLSDAGYVSKSSYNFFTNYGSWLGCEPKYSKSIAYKAVEKEVNALSPKAKADLSDILEGASGAKINCGFGHGASYWKQRTYGGVSDGLATEAFAEMIDSAMACPESLETIKKYLPKSYAIFEEMIEMLVE